MTAIVTQSSEPSSNTGLPVLRRDPQLRDHNGGVVAMFDLAFGWCWPGGESPHDGAVINNMTENIGNLDFQLVSEQSVAHAGGGFDFTGLTAEPANIRGPAGMLSGIAEEQQFLLVMWMKLPAAVDWIPSSSTVCYACSATSSVGYVNGPDLITIQPRNPGAPALSTRRQTTALNTYDQLSILDVNGLHSTVCIIGAWRTGSQSGLMIRGGANPEEPITRTALGAPGALNTQDISGQRFQWGVPDSNNALASIVVARAAHKHRVYRGWLENLYVSGRDPIALLEREWTANVARGAFS